MPLITTLVDFLSLFAQMAELTAILAKSSIYIVGIYAHTREQLLTITEFQEGDVFQILRDPYSLPEIENLILQH